LVETADRTFSDGEYKLEIKGVPLNDGGKECVHIRSKIRELAEELEQFGVKIAKVELKGG